MKTPINLLPSGFSDLLPPYASRERELRQNILTRFQQFGYEEVSPPFLEFEDSLLDQSSLDRQTFRVMDAASQRMMGLRADMTPQIARIAATRMASAPLPLRLCYAGTCLRVKGEGLHQKRQWVQAGIECIGSEGDHALIEVLRCAHEALETLGITDISIDLTLPGLTVDLLADTPSKEREFLQHAIAQKDRHAIRQSAHPLAELLLLLMDGVTLEALSAQPNLPPMISEWQQRIAAIGAALPHITFTLDPLEESGFGYYEAIAFSVFSQSLGCEIGRGGRYRAHDDLPAQGVTLYLSPLLSYATETDSPSRCLILPGAEEEKAQQLRKKGWHTLYGTASSSADAMDEAKQFHCKAIMDKDGMTDV